MSAAYSGRAGYARHRARPDGGGTLRAAFLSLSLRKPFWFGRFGPLDTGRYGHSDPREVGVAEVHYAKR
jgi:hypothetical protein